MRLHPQHISNPIQPGRTRQIRHFRHGKNTCRVSSCGSPYRPGLPEDHSPSVIQLAIGPRFSYTGSFAVRLFCAIDIPEDVSATLRAMLGRLRPLANLRWTSVEKLHITTKFIGEWPDERLSEIQACLRQVVSAPFQIVLGSLAWAPNRTRPRVFLAHVEASPELDALASATERALAGVGIAVEDRPYRPHLTLARVKDRVSLEALQRAATQVAPLGSFRATAQHLYLSAGGKYTKLESFAFL